jgi:hypothetical protein
MQNRLDNDDSLIVRYRREPKRKLRNVSRRSLKA